jgi:branched-chain amino acid aminotransferase
VSTPSITSSILKGITRDVVIDLLKGLEIQVQERDISLSELFTADEAFGTGTASEISPIIEINGREIGDGKPGPITNKVEEKFGELIDKIKTSV